MSASKWFDDWNPEVLYKDDVTGCDDCAKTSPILESGVICGPILRLINMDFEQKLYEGSIMMVVRGEETIPKITYQLGPSLPSESEIIEIEEASFESKLFHKDKLKGDDIWFHRYEIRLPMRDCEQIVKYSIDGKMEPHYRFFMPSLTQNSNVISYSCNGFSLSVDTSKFKGSLWYDVLKKHQYVHYHAILGGGDQIYSDNIKLHAPNFKAWLDTKDPIKKYNTQTTDETNEQIRQFYLEHYLNWYGYGHWYGSTPKSKTTQKCFVKALACIPAINVWDDHDIIDGYGSYNDAFMKTENFLAVGRMAYRYYMLFQHHVSASKQDGDDSAYLQGKQWILGNEKGSPYIGERSHSIFSWLGPNMAMLGLDCRTERKLRQVFSERSYSLIWERLEKELNTLKGGHLLVMLGIPIAYPRLVWLEWLFTSKLLAPIKYLSKKGILANGLVNEFNGDVELLDDLNDHWCARHHKKERNYLVMKLQDIGAKYGVRITILSGDVHLASIGRFRAKTHRHHLIMSEKKEKENTKIIEEPTKDERLMFNIIASAIVNTPPPDAMATLLQKRCCLHHFDAETDEDAVPIFTKEVDGTRKRSDSCFMNKRNWSDIIPVKNVLNNPQLSKELGIKIGDIVIPGVITEQHKLETLRSDDQFNSYPVTSDSLFTTIHVEKDPSQENSQTVSYGLPIPELEITRENLPHAGIKHLNVI
ncbi:uncharacterized protein SKDI_07G5140 [Saccharomyces kudriavzevii IFO 1802]|uniref:PhoD-like phosphatase domain-containing protein n=1 Tax=Saccharomyces kudriavzevii (strain ATCC MYA-4449 / AS 2.2408 / CBS 8840 / NBRC 1802 / NCYC 2889) TaxID=226230 RepID=A0AA35JJ52_SACK1|nr:uncharacterized protein SKDI_07G5140 [Saccharomyces kudriavzevii IFO 1802]CAI4063034.1 hypothetical protein SKDI_07G5140 [Saccharomyces kudriavzevii IFO 1802]